jgi:hypothetical protein
MGDSLDPPRRGWSLAAFGFVVVLVVAVVIEVAALPGPVPQTPGSAPTTYPTNPHRLVSNNLKLGDTLRLGLVTVPQSAAWILASSNSGPSYIGPYAVDLGPDWIVVGGPVLMGGGVTFELGLPVPYVPWLVGSEFVVQCGVITPLASDVAFSNSITLRCSQGPARHILVLRQTAPSFGMPNPAQQADALVTALQLFGDQVTVADDVLPASLLDFDCILDLRFSTQPPPDESARFVQFLRQCGGVFFVSGPYAGNLGGQLRAGWLSALVASILGVEVTISSGGTLSNGSVESVDAGADPAFTGAAFAIAGLPFDVMDEGGNFGPPGAASAGMPWITGGTALGPLVYGMVFDSSEMMSQTVGGRVAVLFAGGSGTFIPGAANPYPDLILSNVAAYLDR